MTEKTNPLRVLLDKILPNRRAESKQDVLMNLRHAEQDGIVPSDAYEMMQRAMFVSDMKVRDVMIPRSQMATIEKEYQLEQCLEVMIESAHSRFPVYDQEKDQFVGILLAKDLLRFFDTDTQQKFSLRDLSRPAILVPETKRLNVLLSEFRSNRNHMAMVVDEYASISGLVTIEDVLEQIVGDIEDEHDYADDDSMIRVLDNSEIMVKAIVPMDEFNTYFSSKLSENVSDTLGGLIAHEAGYIPQIAEKIRIKNFEFEIVHADTRRLHLLKARQMSPTIK